MIDGKLYISKSVYTILCDEGQRLHHAWLETIENHEEPEVIFAAMRAYFSHKNGILTKNFSKKQSGFCPECSGWMQERER